MSKMVIKNKLKLPSELDDNTSFRYQFIVKPVSYAKSLHQHNFSTDQYTQQFKTLPLLEFKFRECFFFEKLMCSLLLTRRQDIYRLTHPISKGKDFSYRVFQLMETGEQRRLIIENPKTSMKYNCKINFGNFSGNFTYLNDFFNDTSSHQYGRKKLNLLSNLSNNQVNGTTDNNSTINSNYKYLNGDVSDICDTLYDFFTVMHEYVDDFSLDCYEKIVTEMGLDYEIYYTLYQSLTEKLPHLFKEYFEKLIDTKPCVTHDQLNDNIELTLNDDQELSDVLCIYNVYSALNETTGNIKIVPNQKKYYHVNNDGDTKDKRYLVDSFKIFFENETDVYTFFENYQHYTEYNLSALTSFHVDYIADKSISYVNTFIPADTIVIQDKVKNSSLNLEVSSRKTPYKNDINGFLVLSAVVINRDQFYNSQEDIECISEYFDSVSGVINNSGIVDDLWYMVDTQYVPRTYFTDDVHRVLQDGMIVTNNNMWYGTHASQITQNWRSALRKEFKKDNYESIRLGLSHRHDNMTMTMLVPITFNSDIEGILKLLNKQKLMGKFKMFKIQSVVLAPYSTVERGKTEKIIDAIADM